MATVSPKALIDTQYHRDTVLPAAFLSDHVAATHATIARRAPKLGSPVALAGPPGLLSLQLCTIAPGFTPSRSDFLSPSLLNASVWRPRA